MIVNMKNNMTIPIVVLLVAVGGFVLVNMTNSQEQVSDSINPDTQVIDNSKQEAFGMDKPVEVQNTDVRYTSFSQQNLAKAQENGKAVLFFSADWCSTCKVTDKDLTQNSSSLPGDITVLRADFDTQKELKAKYKVVSQHTFVQIDQNGEEVTKWSGGGVDEVIQNVL